MIVIVAILLLFGVVVRHKWKNAAAKKEEILRLVAAASDEEAEIAKIEAVHVYESPPPPAPPQIQKRYFCAVCFCPTTTRCSQCKAVRYCSGKCQILHWRQGHKDECRPASSLHDRKESACAVDTASLDQFHVNFNNDTGICSDPTEHLDDCGSSSSSLPCFSSTTEHSETSFDASSTETFESGTSVGPDIVDPGVNKYHISHSASDSDEADIPSVASLNSTVEAANSKIGFAKISKSQPTKPDGFRATSIEDERTGNVASVSKDFVGTTELKSSKSSGFSKTSSSVEYHTNYAHLSSDEITKPMYSSRSGNYQQIPNVDIRNSPCSKSLSTTSLEDFWGNEAQLSRSTETRSLSLRSSENDGRISSKMSSVPNLPSEIKGTQTLSPLITKSLKTSAQKVVEDFRVSKQSKSYTIDIEKDFAGNYKRKIIFPPKLFMQLYSCDSLELLPVGLINCGNSCYANAVLQCLTFTRPIAAYLLQGLHSKTCRKRDWCIICEFERLVQKGQKMKSSLSPVGILSQIQRIGSHLSHGREEDAHDFLRNMIDTMQSIWLEEAHVSGTLAEDSTLLGLTFGGYLRSKIKCMKCLGRSEQYDRMMDLTVEIDGGINTLEQALAKFTRSETLTGDDKYKCSRCMSYEKAKKKLTVSEAPNVVTVVLKRFRSGNLGKLNKVVQFPEVLDLAPYMSGMRDKYCMYHLYAVAVHLNNSSYSGHYISYVKDLRGEWFKIDDSRVSHVRLETVLSAEAYILFYASRTPEGPPLHSWRKNVEGSGKKRNLKTKASYSSEDWEAVCRSGMFDSPSDSSSIFSVSDAGSYSTESTKDSNAEDISGYIFGSAYL